MKSLILGLFTTTCVSAYALTALPAPLIIGGADYYDDRFLSENVFDGNLLTEYASNDLGTATYLDFDFGAPVSISGFGLIQRNDAARVAVSSLSFSDSADFITSFEINNLISTDFALASDVFEFSPITARYVRWSVVNVYNGSFLSVGAAEISFSAVPEPSTYAAVAGLGALGFALVRRRRVGWE